MKRLQLFFFFLTLFGSLTGAKDIRMEMQKELDEMTDRLVSSHLETKVDEQVVSGYMNAIRPDGSFLIWTISQYMKVPSFQPVRI